MFIWNTLTLCKQMSSNNLFKNSYLQTARLQIICTYKEDLALNNPQGLLCHKTPTNHHASFIFETDLQNTAKFSTKILMIDFLSYRWWTV